MHVPNSGDSEKSNTRGVPIGYKYRGYIYKNKILQAEEKNRILILNIWGHPSSLNYFTVYLNKTTCCVLEI